MIGPPHIAPDQAPGGVVIHVYAVDEGRERLVVERRIPGDARARDAAYIALLAEEDAADAAAAAVGPVEGLVLVAYDGDSGQRWPNLGSLVHPPGER